MYAKKKDVWLAGLVVKTHYNIPNTYKAIEILSFAHLHLINIHEEPMTSLVLISNFKNVLKTLI